MDIESGMIDSGDSEGWVMKKYLGTMYIIWSMDILKAPT